MVHDELSVHHNADVFRQTGRILVSEQDLEESISIAEAYREEVQRTIENIQQQIDRAHARERDQGQPIDAEWLRRAKHARTEMRKRVQSIDASVGELRRAQRTDRNERLERHFVDIAKAVLDDAVFQDILATARARLDSEHPP